MVLDGQSLRGETIVVTGASRGMGREMALRFSREGATVALVSRDQSTLESVQRNAPNDTLVAPANVTDRDEVEAAITETVDAFGPIDTLVNNAGIAMLSLGDGRRPAGNVPVETWRRILEVNLTGMFLCCRAVLPDMQARSQGNIINISSALGRTPTAGMAPYVASKFGVEGFTKTVALDYESDGLNVNGLDPGGRVATGFFEQFSEAERREMKPPDVMNDAAVLLARQSPHATTGLSLPAAEWESRLSNS